MPVELSPDLPLEIAHLLLIDVVGYSKLLVNEQIELLHVLTCIVRGTECFQAAEKSEKLIRLPTGDGMALLFFDSPEQPVTCALQISKQLQIHPDIRVRMGVHSGPVNRVTDVNDRSNVAGAGINVAQRVMDCGDAGHILLSKHLADDLTQYRHWQPYIHDIGECEVKHGLRLHIVNLYKDGLGNPALPEKFRQHRWRKFAMLAAVLLSAVALAVSTVVLFHRASTRAHNLMETGPVIPEKSIAVLPFENLTDDKQNAYFADGVQDGILTDLAKVADLKVISRTSVMPYKNSAQRNLREIARALGVSYVLEGTVQRAGSRARVNVQLIDARTDGHVWGERYDRDLADVFAIETELVERIVAQLQSTLSPIEKAAIKQKPTVDIAAYDLYVRGKVLIDKAVFNEPRETNLREAVGLLEQAVRRDPSFALAFYQLAHAHDQIYFLGYDQTQARLALAAAAIQSLQRLRADSGEAHLALAKHFYWGYLDYDRSRQELKAARSALPNDPLPLLLTGYIDRRQERWDESLRNMERALELDPRNFFILQQISLTYNNLRRYSDMSAVLDRALAIAPNDISLRIQRAMIDLDWHADTKPLHATIQKIMEEEPAAVRICADRWLFLAFCERDMNAAIRALSVVEAGGYNEAVFLPRAWSEGLVARLRGDQTAAQDAFKAARAEVEKTANDQTNYGPALCALGLLDAALGNRKDAVLEGRRAVELLPVTKDALDGAVLNQYLAVIYAWTNEKDAAVEQLGTVMTVPGYLSYGQLRLDPLWDSLRDDLRFKKLVDSLAPK